MCVCVFQSVFRTFCVFQSVHKFSLVWHMGYVADVVMMSYYYAIDGTILK